MAEVPYAQHLVVAARHHNGIHAGVELAAVDKARVRQHLLCHLLLLQDAPLSAQPATRLLLHFPGAQSGIYRSLISHAHVHVCACVHMNVCVGWLVGGVYMWVWGGWWGGVHVGVGWLVGGVYMWVCINVCVGWLVGGVYMWVWGGWWGGGCTCGCGVVGGGGGVHVGVH